MLIISTFCKNNFWRLNFIILDNDAGCIETASRFYSNSYFEMLEQATDYSISETVNTKKISRARKRLTL